MKIKTVIMSILFTLIAISGFLVLDRNYFSIDIYRGNQWTTEFIDANTNVNIDPVELSKIKIGIIDSGFNYEHPNLNLKSINPKQQNVSYNEYHGTYVSALISSKGTKSIPYNGFIPGHMILVYDIPSDELNVNTLIEAFYEMLNNNVDIINVSLGTNYYSKDLEEIIKKVIANDITVIASAGNTSSEDNVYPAAFDIAGLISVGAVNKDNTIVSQSTLNKHIDVFAPGADVFTLDQNNDIIPVSGTSIATPIVTSQAILLKAQCPGLTPEEIHNLIKSTSKKILTKWNHNNINISIISFEDSFKKLHCNGGIS